MISEFCLVVKLSSNIVTENCRRIWVLSSMTAHVLPLIPGCVQCTWHGPEESQVHHVWTHTPSGGVWCGQLTANRRGRARVVLILLTSQIWVIILPTCIRWSRKGSIAKSDTTITCHNAELSLYKNSSDILWQYRVPYANISSSKYIMWVIIKYLHWKNRSFEIYPAPHSTWVCTAFHNFLWMFKKKKKRCCMAMEISLCKARADEWDGTCVQTLSPARTERHRPVLKLNKSLVNWLFEDLYSNEIDLKKILMKKRLQS